MHSHRSINEQNQVMGPKFHKRLTVVPEGSSGPIFVVRALLDCVDSALEYSGSICGCDIDKDRAGGWWSVRAGM